MEGLGRFFGSECFQKHFSCSGFHKGTRAPFRTKKGTNYWHQSVRNLSVVTPTPRPVQQT